MTDPRQLLKDSWDRLTDEEHEELQALVMDAWRQTLAATRDKTVKGVFRCQKCDHSNLVEVPVEMPDLVTRAKAFEIFANQAYGKPQETRRVQVDVGEVTLEALQRMSMTELARYGGFEIVDGEIVEAPPELPPAA